MQQPVPVTQQVDGRRFTMSENPVEIKCHHCNNHVKSMVEKVSGKMSYGCFAVIFCCVSPICACLPLKYDFGLKDTIHYCPVCFNVVAKTTKEI